MQSNNEFGFTLIECLVALLIIAIVLASTTKSIGMSVEDVRASYMREAATWVADNQFNQFILNKTYPQLGTNTEYVHMAGIDFAVTSVVSSMPNPYFRKIDISVVEKSNPEFILFKTVNFISQY